MCTKTSDMPVFDGDSHLYEWTQTRNLVQPHHTYPNKAIRQMLTQTLPTRLAIDPIPSSLLQLPPTPHRPPPHRSGVRRPSTHTFRPTRSTGPPHSDGVSQFFPGTLRPRSVVRYLSLRDSWRSPLPALASRIDTMRDTAPDCQADQKGYQQQSEYQGKASSHAVSSKLSIDISAKPYSSRSS